MSDFRQIHLELIAAPETGELQAIAADIDEPCYGCYPLGRLAGRLLPGREFLVRAPRVVMCDRTFARFYGGDEAPAIPRGIRLFFYAEVRRG